MVPVVFIMPSPAIIIITTYSWSIIDSRRLSIVFTINRSWFVIYHWWW
jgi:hypothetical protein